MIAGLGQGRCAMLAAPTKRTRERQIGRHIGRRRSASREFHKEATMLRTSALGRRTVRMLAASLVGLLLLGATSGAGPARAGGECLSGCPTAMHSAFVG